MPRKPNDWMILFARYSSLAFLLPAAAFVGYLIGYLLDRWLGMPFLRLVFLLLGVAAGVLNVLRELAKDDK
jgi:F0F1-type ATP synthase assembly protein I